MAQTVKDVLVAARELIAVPADWTGNVHSTFRNPGPPRSAVDAVWDAWPRDRPSVEGAIVALDAAAVELGFPVLGEACLRPCSILNSEADHPTVLRMFDLAIERASDAS